MEKLSYSAYCLWNLYAWKMLFRAYFHTIHWLYGRTFIYISKVTGLHLLLETVLLKWGTEIVCSDLITWWGLAWLGWDTTTVCSDIYTWWIVTLSEVLVTSSAAAYVTEAEGVTSRSARVRYTWVSWSWNLNWNFELGWECGGAIL